MVCAPVSQTMNQPRVTVKSEDDRLVSGEQHVELFVRQTVRMFALRLERHQVDHVDDTNLQFREMVRRYPPPPASRAWAHRRRKPSPHPAQLP